jgi:hypothetical protein
LTDVSKFVENLALNQEAIVTKPLKALSLYNTTKNLAASNGTNGAKAAKKTSAMDSSYAEVSQFNQNPTHVTDTDTVASSQQYPLKICYIDDSNVNVAVGKKVCMLSVPCYCYLS